MQIDLACRDAYLAAVESLPMLERATFLLARVDGLSFRQISFRLGMDTNNVEFHFANALSSICAKLADY